MHKEFWKDKRVLITGFEGFLGSHLTKTLIKTRANIVGLDIKTFRKETILGPKDYKKITVYKGSVTNFKLLERILQKHSINVIFHLAAEAIVESGYKNPRKTFSTNIRGTWEVLEAARKKGDIEAIIVASSDKAYGEHRKLPYREEMPLLANHPYDVSKACADLIAKTYAHTYNLPVCITRCGNIFGPGDFNFSRIVPDCIQSVLNNRTLLIRSDGKFVRDYIYIDDIVKGYLLLAEKMPKLRLFGEAFNFSNENPLAVIELVKKIYKLARKKENYKILDQAVFEIKNQYLSSHKARRILNWKPKFSLEDGLKITIDWYSNYFKGRNSLVNLQTGIF